MHLTRIYLRASTSSRTRSAPASRSRLSPPSMASPSPPHTQRTRAALRLRVPNCFVSSGDSKPGDILLIEQVDRLSRLSASDWLKLRSELDARQIRVVALDLPTSWQLASTSDEFTSRMFGAINGMMLDMLAAVARKDYDDRRRRASAGHRQGQGRRANIAGRPENVDRNAGIGAMLRGGASWSAIQKATGCSRATISKIARRSAYSDIGPQGQGQSPCHKHTTSASVLIGETGFAVVSEMALCHTAQATPIHPTAQLRSSISWVLSASTSPAATYFKAAEFGQQVDAGIK